MKYKSVFLWLIGGCIGGLAGYFYFVYYGCQGSCAITSSPVNSTLYGILLGGLVFSMFDSKKK